MRTAIIMIVLSVAAGAWADVIELPLDCAGTYDINTPSWSYDFDLGVTFSEISYVYIDWSGEITAGLAINYTDPCNPFPLEVGIRASFNPPFRYVEVWGGEGTYPASELFDTLSEIQAGSWSDLFDGQGTIRIQYQELVLLNGRYTEHGSVMLDDATLIVEGTVVPEPTTILLLSFGAGLMVRMRNSRTYRQDNTLSTTYHMKH